MAVTVTRVIPGSPAEEAGFQAGDRLLKVNGNEIGDVLDYQFYSSETEVELEFESGGELQGVIVEKDEYEDLGLEFETYLMDKQHSCTCLLYTSRCV